MTTLTEGGHAGGFIVSEANGTRSRVQGTILSGEVLTAGQVLGKVTASGKYVAHDPAATDGPQAAAGILVYPIDATGGDKQAAIIVRDAEVNLAELNFNGIATSDENDAIADLLALGIVTL